MTGPDYKAAYFRQKKARELAEQLLEDKSRELYNSNQAVLKAYQELKEQKSQLLHKEKLASIGQLSAGVAHEINNPSGYVRSNLNTLKRYLNKIYTYIEALEASNSDLAIQKLREQLDIAYVLHDLTELVSDSLEGMERVASIVQSLKDFARPDPEEAVSYNLNDCIRNTLKLVNSEIKYQAQVDTELAELPPLCGQPGSMSQVFLNLIINAAQAIPTQGNIHISTRLATSGERPDHQQWIIACVSDTGTGIPEDIIDKIFDPFYSTKKIGEGTGLGLAIVHSLLKKQGGLIRVEKNHPVGTRFKLLLPVRPPAGAEAGVTNEPQ
ncbi:sensor histidine kinase [Agaribacterium haliotis]|uniref:sensor histidine kinase n=1 Tax=Agaribacterium haliotis TaxID=2013869 RepID=UPI000BB59227|nr:ATP-binding protein [Agaribacterium haliotis]